MTGYERYLLEQLESSARQAGRLSYYVGQLLALDHVRGEMPAEYLREALQRCAEGARRADLPHVKPDHVEQYVAEHRQAAQFWRDRQSWGTAPRRGWRGGAA